MNARWVLLSLLIAGCRSYDPMPLDCQISCGLHRECPERTSCREGVCRTSGSTGKCECREGEQRLCGDALGECRQGVQLCVNHFWGVCDGAVMAQSERCNGLDDDCDGAVDEDIALPPPCPRTIGVCSAASQQCRAGAWQACDAQTYGPFFEEVEVSCDRLDNDCDGLLDGHAALQLASGITGPWFFLTTAGGFALVANTDAGAELHWLSKALAPLALQVTSPAAALATSRGDTLILTSITDAGVVFSDFELDGGTRARTVQSWIGPAALEVSVDFAVASVNGRVELLSLLDGGAPVPLGPDIDGNLRLSQSGHTLAWSGGLTRTLDGATLRTTAIEPLVSLMELEFTIAGVPRAQPSQPVFFADLVAGTPAQTTGFLVPMLSSIKGTAHLGEVLLIGIEAPDALWFTSERGKERRVIAGGLRSAQVTVSDQPMTAVAWENRGTIWASRQCAP